MSKRHAILTGSGVLLLALATGCANTVPVGMGTSAVSGPQMAGAGLISNNAGGLISNNAGGLISNNAGGLISNNAGGLISNNAGGLISNNAGGLISNNAGGLAGSVKGPSAGLISNNAGGLISNNAGGLISNNAGGLISNNAGGLISNAAGGYRISAVGDEPAAVANCKVAVFNERGEMVSYNWVVTDKNGNYQFPRLKASGPLLFVKAVYQVGDKQVNLMAAAKAPRAGGEVSTTEITPASTLVAKKVQEMIRLRVVSVATIKAEATTALAKKLEPVLTKEAAVLVVLQTPAQAAKTFDLAMGEVAVDAPALKTQISTIVAAAPAVITETPVETAVTAPPSDPTPAPSTSTNPADGSGNGSGTGSGSGLKATVTTIEGLALASASTIDSPTGSNKVYVANGGAPLFVTATDLETASVTNETVSGTVLAAAFAGNSRYYMTTDKIVTPDGTSVALSGVSSPTDFIIANGDAYVTSEANNCVYKVNLTTGNGVLFAGSATARGLKDGIGTDALFQAPRGITFDAGTQALYVADTSNLRIRKVALSNASVTSIAGNTVASKVDGTGLQAGFGTPYDITSDGNGNLYVADYAANAIRKVTTAGVVTTIAGTGTRLSKDGTGDAGTFSFPTSVAYGVVNGKPVIWVGEGTKIRVVEGW
jgi:sugar lactone lactonase YvrE